MLYIHTQDAIYMKTSWYYFKLTIRKYFFLSGKFLFKRKSNIAMKMH